MISKRDDADRQFAKVTRKEKAERTESTSRSITANDKAVRDLKTAMLKEQREGRDAKDAQVKKAEAVARDEARRLKVEASAKAKFEVLAAESILSWEHICSIHPELATQFRREAEAAVAMDELLKVAADSNTKSAGDTG